MTASVALVVVSHSGRIAEGVVELAGQMAGTTTMIAAGGTDEGGIGTSFDRVQAAIETASASGGGVVVLCDLGSAILTAETALEFLDEEVAARVRIADAPLVEGSVAAAVAAEGGGTLDDVVAAATSAAGAASGPLEPERSDVSAPVAELRHPPASSGSDAPVSRSTTLVNRDGLHARPAAELVKHAAGFEAAVTVNGVDAKSLLRIMGLGLRAGSTVTVTAEGTDAEAAVTAMIGLIDSGFGEV